MKKEIIKEKAKEITKVLVFIILFLFLIEGASVTVFSSKTATSYNNKLRDTYSFVNEPENSVQIVCVGNSDLYSGFSPLDLWKNYGYTSTVCAAPNQSIKESQNILEEVFERQSPKLVIVEADMLYGYNPEKRNQIEKAGALSDFFDSANPDYFTRDVENFFTVFKFHNYWKGGKSNKKNFPFNTHGYRFNNKVCKLKKNNYMQITMQAEELTRISRDQMNSLVAFCKENGAEVIIAVMPSVSSWNYERHNGVKEYADGQKIPFIDLNLCYKEMGISMKTCFRDNGNHLNYYGAKAATEYLGEYIHQTHPLEDRSGNSAYASWNNHLKRFEEYLEYTEKDTKPKK